jgi:cobalt-zinc-cadmium efflux system membrane fusion protein
MIPIRKPDEMVESIPNRNAPAGAEPSAGGARGDARPRRRLQLLTIGLLLLIGAGIGVLGDRRMTVRIDPSGHEHDHDAASEHAHGAERNPAFVKQGERIVVPEGSQLRTKLVIEPVGERDIQRTLVLPAMVEADPAKLVKVLPPLAGRVMQLKVTLGERVELGQPLVVLDSPDLAAAYADYDRAKVLLALALKNRDRQRDLAKIGGSAVKDLQQAETDYVTAEVELDRSRARLVQIGVSPDTTEKTRLVTVSAPSAGSIIDLGVAPGAFWNDATAPMMTVADLSTVWITANVPEKDTALVAKGQPVTVTLPAYAGEVLRGTVLFVSDVLDPDTRRTKVRIAFPNPDLRLKPSMFASVSFETSRRKAVVVPTTALVLKNDAERVFVEVAPWTFEPRDVEAGFQEGAQTILKSGIVSGDRVVVRGGVLLND